jgi:hypothetical protein
MSAQGTEPTVRAGNDSSARSWRDWRLLMAGALLLLSIVIIGLELWDNPPRWLRGTRQLVVGAVHWVRVHWATSGALGVIATVVVFLLQRRAEHQRHQRDQAQRDEAARNESARQAKATENEQARQAKAAEDARRRLLATNCMVDESTGWLPRVGQVTNPISLGVHPAADLGDPDLDAEGRPIDLPAKVPIYVPRDKDAELDSKLSQGGLVLVVGDSTAGKSRAAYEAIHRLFGQRWLLVPNSRQSLRALLEGGLELRETVVWLNDLERWLGPDGLDLGLLRRLLGDGHRQVVVVATMRASEYTSRAPEQEFGRSDTEQELRQVEREVLDQSARVDLVRRFSTRERERATERSWDPRIADALPHAGVYGLAEYIAAGPRLWQRWRDGLAVDNPPERLAGAAMVSVAVDCRRAGLTQPTPEQMLRDLYLKYLDASVARRLDPAAFSAGVTWATQPIQATSALLTQEDNGYVAFDYLVDRVQADPSAAPVLDVVWLRLLHDVSRDDAYSVGLAAFRADRQDLAEQAWRKAAEAGNHSAETRLGVLIALQERDDEAEQWLRRAAEAGNHDAETRLGALLLRDRRDPDQAEQWLLRAAEAGQPRRRVQPWAAAAAARRHGPGRPLVPQSCRRWPGGSRSSDASTASTP